MARRNPFSRRCPGHAEDMFGGGNGNYFRIRSQRDAQQYMEDERDRDPGRGGGRVAWIALGVVLIVVLGLALAAAIGG